MFGVRQIDGIEVLYWEILRKISPCYNKTG